MHKSFVWTGVGALLMIIGAAMLIPAAAGIYYGETEYRVFVMCAGVTVLCGALLFAAAKPQKRKNGRMPIRDGYAVAAYGWLAAAAFAMVPYLLTGAAGTITDAFFEAMSGFTMTGASVLSDVESQAHCVLLWRSLTQWLGGLGILVLFVAILSGQGHGAMQLFQVEATGNIKTKLPPKTVETACGLGLIYLIYTAVVIVLYWLAGMGLFDAVNHGLTVISTGGFSTCNASIGAYHNQWIDWITVLAMLAAGMNYALIFHAWRNKSLRGFAKSLELRVYLGIAVVAAMLVTWFIAPMYDYNLALALRHGLFQTVSVLTTTGFVICNIEQWAAPALFVLVLLMLCGACAGSAGGGIKIDRHVILLQKAVQEIRRFLHPNMVTRLKSNSQMVDDDVVLGISTFFYSYIALIVAGAAILSMLGIELLGALTAVMSCLGGIGPALGIGAYAALPAAAKWLLSFFMLIGRLEIYAVLVLIRPFHAKRKENERQISLEKLERDGVIEPFVRDYDDD